jgi:hypothetical protein
MLKKVRFRQVCRKITPTAGRFTGGSEIGHRAVQQEARGRLRVVISGRSRDGGLAFNPVLTLFLQIQAGGPSGNVPRFWCASHS